MWRKRKCRFYSLGEPVIAGEAQGSLFTHYEESLSLPFQKSSPTVGSVFGISIKGPSLTLLLCFFRLLSSLVEWTLFPKAIYSECIFSLDTGNEGAGRGLGMLLGDAS